MNLPESSPSIRDFGLFDLQVRVCANEHMPLTWVDESGKQVSDDASTWWVLHEVRNVNSLEFMGVTVTGHGVGRPDWHPSVLADPEKAMNSFGTCLYDSAITEIDRVKNQIVAQMNGLQRL